MPSGSPLVTSFLRDSAHRREAPSPRPQSGTVNGGAIGLEEKGG